MSKKTKQSIYEKEKRMTTVSGIYFNMETRTYYRFTSPQDKLSENLRAYLKCEIFEVVNIDREVSVWMDEEFNFKVEHWMKEMGCVPVHIFDHPEFSHPLQVKGSCIFLGGTDNKGNTLSLGKHFSMVGDVDDYPIPMLSENSSISLAGRTTVKQGLIMPKNP